MALLQHTPDRQPTQDLAAATAPGQAHVARSSPGQAHVARSSPDFGLGGAPPLSSIVHRPSSIPLPHPRVKLLVTVLGVWVPPAGEMVFEVECEADVPLAWAIGTIAVQVPGLRPRLVESDSDWVVFLDGHPMHWWEDLQSSGTLLLMPALSAVFPQ